MQTFITLPGSSQRIPWKGLVPRTGQKVKLPGKRKKITIGDWIRDMATFQATVFHIRTVM